MWINRLHNKNIAQAVASRPVILLTGARQTGKSSLLQKSYPDHPYITLDNLAQAEAATTNPEHFLRTLSTPVIIDEIQYAPELLRSLKQWVDSHRQTFGQWLLTGSQQFHLMENVSESLAGRIAILHLETLSAKELRHAKIPHLSDCLWRGGYPELWAQPQLSTQLFFDGYLKTYIERDLKSIVEVANLMSFQRLLRVLATRSGQLLNYRDISRDIGVSDVTIRRWLHALQIGGIIYLLPPYHANIGKRLVKSPKVYFADQGLLCYLLDIQNQQDFDNHIHKGQLWENFVFTEIIKTTQKQPGINLFFYRDQAGTEVDFVIEDKQTVHFIEVKNHYTKNIKLTHMQKVTALFKKQATQCHLYTNINSTAPLMINNCQLLNPLFNDIVI